MSQVKVLYDVGRKQGMFGTGVIFLGELVTGGQKVLFWEGLTWANFISLADLETAVLEGKATITSVLPYASLAATIPSTATLNSQGGFVVSNISECSWAGNIDPNAPLFAYTATSATAPTNRNLVTAATFAAWKAGTLNPNTPTAGTGGGGSTTQSFVDANSDGKDDTTGLTKAEFEAKYPPAKNDIWGWITTQWNYLLDNPLYLAVFLFGASELIGTTNFLGFRKKPKFKLFKKVFG